MHIDLCNVNRVYGIIKTIYKVSNKNIKEELKVKAKEKICKLVGLVMEKNIMGYSVHMEIWRNSVILYHYRVNDGEVEIIRSFTALFSEEKVCNGYYTFDEIIEYLERLC